MHVGRYDERATSSVGSFLANLPELLGAMVVDPRCLVAVIEFEDVRYVQYWVARDGAVVAEVISNLNIGDAVALTAEDEEHLRRAGWSEPSPGSTPNWRVEARDIAGVMKVVTMTRDAVYDVLRERDGNAVSVRMWEGRSTASPNDIAQPPARVRDRWLLRSLHRRVDNL